MSILDIMINTNYVMCFINRQEATDIKILSEKIITHCISQNIAIEYSYVF
jgi:hypothetical protein